MYLILILLPFFGFWISRVGYDSPELSGLKITFLPSGNIPILPLPPLPVVIPLTLLSFKLSKSSTALLA